MSQNIADFIFIPFCGAEQVSLRNQLSSVLKMAGMKVVPEDGIYTENSLKLLNEQIQTANCYVIILFPQYAPLIDEEVSLAKFQYHEIKKAQLLNPDSKIVVWLPPTTNIMNTDATQIGFINEIRNSITKNMIFSNALSPILLADDIRSLLEKKQEVYFDINSTDIFLISNQLDESEANEIIEMLSDIVPVENLNIIQDSDMDYTELCKQQISKSKLAVIYFKETSDWALPFAQQVWKKIGGAASHTPILLIGDEDPDTNKDKKFKAPKVISLIVSGELIPLEIKVQYDNVIEAKS
jgi:hypothetical protein